MTYEMALEALADPTRRSLFERLRDGPQTVGALAQTAPVSQPAVSQHLKVLREAGLVAVRKEGTRRFYSMSDEGLTALRAYVESFWEGVLEQFAASDQA